MNILLISHDYPPYKGGIANVSYQMAHQLNSLGENIIVVAQKTKGYKEFDRNNKFLTYRCTNIFFLRELALILFLPYLVLRYKIDVIYILMWCRGGFAVFLTSRFFNIPYIIHVHGLEFLDYKKTLFDKIKYSFLREKYKRLIFENARRIIAGSNYTKNIVIKSGDRKDNVDVVFNGVDINRFRPDLETNPIVLKHKLKNKIILLSVSRLYEHKGHDTVIRLLPQLLIKIPNAVYLIVGSGKNKDFLESLVRKLNLQNNVIFTGYVDELSLPLYYNVCDVFILLSKERLDRAEFEGFGLVFLEANSCCRPVIGASTGGISDAIIDGKTGYLVDPNNDQEIVNKIISLLENKELARRIGEEGRRRIISEGLTWESRGRKIQIILASELKKTRDFKSNILLISHDYPPYKGGIANISYNVANWLSEKEKVLVVAPAVRGCKDIDNNSKLYTIRVVDIKLIREVVLFFTILYLIFKHKIEVIYNLTWYPSAAVSYFASLLTGVPYVIQVYAMDYFEDSRGILNKLKYNLLRIFVKRLTFARAKKIITLSGVIKDRLIVRGIDALKIKVIPPGIDSACFVPGLDAREVIRRHGLENKKILLSVARLVDYKGHDMVIKALPRLISRFPDIVYLIVGEGAYEYQLRKLVEELKLNDRVIFAGWQDVLLPLYYNACQIFLMLSREVYSEAKMEGYGIVFLEASACGKPIIAGRSGGIEDAVIEGVTGLLVNPIDLDEIESSITKILSDKNYADFLGANGIERIKKEGLDWYSISEKIKGILLESKG